MSNKSAIKWIKYKSILSERNPAISVLLTEDTAIDTSPLVFDNVITNIGDGYR